MEKMLVIYLAFEYLDMKIKFPSFYIQSCILSRYRLPRGIVCWAVGSE